MQTTQYPYLGRLDHLRFLAATLVVLFHHFHQTWGDLRSGNPLVSVVDEGHTGIALFMVISGFIFTVIAGNKEIHYASFIRNRCIRIYPLLIVAAFLQLLISTYSDHRNYGFLQLLGWLIPFRSETIGLSPQFQQMWTIWVELQFYLIFPFLLLFARRYGNRYLWGLLGFLLMLRTLVFLATGEVRHLAYETLFGRLDQFIVGMLLGRLWSQRSPQERERSLSATFGLMGLLFSALLCLFTLHVFSLRVGFTAVQHPVWTVWPLLEAAVWGLFMWFYLHVRLPGAPSILHWVGRGVASLGTISFSIYVFHNLVIAAYRPHASVLSWTGQERLDTILTGIICVMPAVLLLATISYHWVEKPFLSLRKGYLR